MSAIHAEYPTPFRCSMQARQFKLMEPDTRSQRGHFDIVVLNRESAIKCDYEVLRSQFYQNFYVKLSTGELSLPFLNAVIEIKLFRDLAHPNRTESARQQAEYAEQAIRKVAATLETTKYYSKPFAKQGLVILLDNSDLVCSGNSEKARNKFLARLNELVRWEIFPSTLSCIWATPQGRKDYQGKK